MIISKIDYTAEEAARDDELSKQAIDLFRKIMLMEYCESRAADEETAQKFTAKLQEKKEKYSQAMSECIKIRFNARQRYISSLIKKKKKILANVSEILGSLSLDDYKQPTLDLKQDEAKQQGLYYVGIGSELAPPSKIEATNWVCDIIDCEMCAWSNSNFKSDDELIALVQSKVYELIQAEPVEDEILNIINEEKELYSSPNESKSFDVFRTTHPNTFFSINDVASNTLFNPEKESKALLKYGKTTTGQIFFTDIGIFTGKKRKQELTSVLSVWYDFDDNITFTKDNKAVILTDYDRAVFNAIITLYKNGMRAFTLPVLYGIMTGKDAHYVTLTASIEKGLLKSLSKLEKTKVELDFSSEKDRYTFIDENGSTLQLCQFKESIISIGEGDFLLNGQPVHGYILNHKPKLLIYAEAKKQLVSTPTKALDLGIGIKNTPEVIALRQFLIDEIARIKSPKQSNHIKYSSIYARLDCLNDAELSKKGKEKARASARKSALKILDAFKANDYIIDYKEVMQGKTYHHIEITPQKDANAI